jgi:hypothetical protein
MRQMVMCALLMAGITPVMATMYVAADLGTLAGEARAIAHGRVVALESRWTDDRRAIETLVTLEVEEYLKGDLGPAVTLRVPGGDMGPYRSIMLGAPHFVQGEDVIVFLAATGPAVPHLLGLAQGVFRVSGDAALGPRVVTPEVLQLPGATAVGDARVVRGDPARRPLPLAAFEQQVRALVGHRLAQAVLRQRGAR